MGPVVPFIRISNGDYAAGQDEFRAPLVISGEPEFTLGKIPAGPFGHAVLVGESVAVPVGSLGRGKVAVVDGPTHRRSIGPHLEILLGRRKAGFVHRRG